MKILKISSRFAIFELQSSKPYYYNSEYDVYLNDEFIFRNDKNIFSVFNLLPNTTYKIKVLDMEISFNTLDESCMLNVYDFNALGNGIDDDTVKIQSAIMCCPDNGCVYIDKGTYLVSNLFLKSNMTLYLSKGAKLIAKTNRMDHAIFPGLVNDYNFGVWEGSEVNNFCSIINLVNVCNTTIAGEGEIDCRAEDGDWYINHRVMNVAYRGHAMFFNRCSNINVVGLYVHNTQSWAIHPYFTNNIDFINVKVTNKASMPTTDGIDPDCSCNVRIMGCYFNVGDDCIAIKSGTIDLAKKYKVPCSNIVISNNMMEQGHGGVVFGSELSGGINNVIVENCVFKNTDRGLRIKTRRGRGHIGIIDNVSFDNIYMDNVKTPFVINMYYNMGPKGGHEEYVWTTKRLEFNEKTPIIGEFEFKNMVCENCWYAAGVFLGLPESKIKGINIENVKFSYNKDVEAGYAAMIEHNFTLKNAGIYALNVQDIKINNTTFLGLDGEKIIRKETE